VSFARSFGAWAFGAWGWGHSAGDEIEGALAQAEGGRGHVVDGGGGGGRAENGTGVLEAGVPA
jgi:hypothetical protein